MPPPLPPDLFDTLPPAVQAYIRYQEGRLADLEAKPNQNWSNSSKLPSSDVPQVKPAPPTPPRAGGGASPATVNHDIRAARGFVRWLERFGRVGTDPLEPLAATRTSSPFRGLSGPPCT